MALMIGKEAVGIDRGNIARRVVTVAEEGGALRIQVLEAGIAIKRPVGIQGQAGIGEDRGAALLRIAVTAGDGIGRDGGVDIGAVGEPCGS
ncbi:MAG: hypothetical protein WDN06_19385 [Asticcacaulis sp.]